MVHFGEFMKTWSLRSKPDRSVLIGQKLVENAKIKKFKWDIFGDFSNTVYVVTSGENFLRLLIEARKLCDSREVLELLRATFAC